MPDLREQDAIANTTPTRDLLAARPLEPATRRAIAGFKVRGALRGFPPTAALLRLARRVRGGRR